MTFSNIKASLAARIRPTKHSTPPLPGLYHYQFQGIGEESRVHLRVESGGDGLLIINASRIFHLNPTATMMAYLYLEKNTPEQVELNLKRQYHVNNAQAHQDYAVFKNQMEEIIRPDGACPVCDLDLEIRMPFSTRPSAPYRMDLALTYRCNNDCAHCYNARPRQQAELTTQEWKECLDLLWQAGIPHIVFTGGEPTLRQDLPELIAHAEKNGQITGLNTNGRRLKDKIFLGELVSAGLDHVQITIESHNPDIHDHMVARSGAWDETTIGIQNALLTRLYVMTNTTLLEENSAFLPATLDYLAHLGVPTIGLNALIYSGHGLNINSGLPEAKLPPLLDFARKFTQENGQKLIWYTPTQYCHFDPMQLDLGVKGCTAALYNMCIEPNGDVIPCQSYYSSLGNLRDATWESIWNHELAVNLRERRKIPAACDQCSYLAECGGGCPLAQQAHKTAEPVPFDPLLI